MTRDDIIRMSREAGFVNTKVPPWSVFEHFAALVAAAERERLKWDGIHSCHAQCDRPACVAVRKAVEAEREACAKLCEDLIGTRAMARHCADAIRARGNA